MLSNCPYVHLFIRPSVLLLICPSVHWSTRPSFCLSIHPSVHFSTKAQSLKKRTIQNNFLLYEWFIDPWLWTVIADSILQWYYKIQVPCSNMQLYKYENDNWISEFGIYNISMDGVHVRSSSRERTLYNNVWWKFSQNSNVSRKHLQVSYLIYDTKCFNPLRLKQNGRHFADNTFKCIFLNENYY